MALRDEIDGEEGLRDCCPTRLAMACIACFARSAKKPTERERE